ncbi:proline-rich protein 22 [Theristicus caerulescens]
MALPPLWLAPHSPWALPAPWLLQPFALPETFYPQGSANLCQLPGEEQPLPAAWAPPVQGAPQAPPPGLQRAPCGCFFDPRVFHIQWTSTDLPPPATATLGHGAASLLGAALWDPGTPQGQLQHLPPYNHQGRAVASPPQVLPTSIPDHQLINISSAATPAGTPPGSSVPTSPSAAPHNQAPGDPAGDLTVSEEALLEEALRLFGCSLDTVEVSQDDPSSSSVPEDPGDTGTAIPHRDFASLLLPEELLTPDYSVPEMADAILSLEKLLTIGTEPQELLGDADADMDGDLPPPQELLGDADADMDGDLPPPQQLLRDADADMDGDLPPPQPAVPEKRGKQRAKSTLPKPPRKRRALAASTGVAGGGLEPGLG